MSRLERWLLLASALVAGAVLLPLALLVRDGWPPLREADRSLLEVLRLPDGLARDAARALTQLGAPLLLELAALVAVLALVARGRRRLAGYLAATVFGAQLLSYSVKLLVERIRPCVDLASCPDSASFPSGHAVGATSFWTSVAVLLLPIVGRRTWVLLALPVLVGLTRLLLGVHFPSDVVAGLLLGGCWTAAMTVAFAAWRQHETGSGVELDDVLAAGLEPSEEGRQ